MKIIKSLYIVAASVMLTGCIFNAKVDGENVPISNYGETKAGFNSKIQLTGFLEARGEKLQLFCNNGDPYRYHLIEETEVQKNGVYKFNTTIPKACVIASASSEPNPGTNMPYPKEPIFVENPTPSDDDLKNSDNITSIDNVEGGVSSDNNPDVSDDYKPDIYIYPTYKYQAQLFVYLPARDVYLPVITPANIECMDGYNPRLLGYCLKKDVRNQPYGIVEPHESQPPVSDNERKLASEDNGDLLLEDEPPIDDERRGMKRPNPTEVLKIELFHDNRGIILQ